METILFGLAIGSFILAAICAIVAGVLHRKLGVHDALNFLRNKKVTPTSTSSKGRSKRRPTKANVKVKEKDTKPTLKGKDTKETVVAKHNSADDPTDILKESKPKAKAKVKDETEVEIEDTEKPTSVLEEETEKPTSLLEEDTERPTSLLEEEETERPTSLLEEESEAPTTILEEESEKPTTVLRTDEDKETQQDEFVTGNVADKSQMEKFDFEVVESQVVVHTDEVIDG